MSPEPDFDAQSPALPGEPWRQEVASCLHSYRVRRRRKNEGETSMRLDFNSPAEPDEPAEAAKTVAVDTDFYRRANAAFDESFDIPLAHATIAPESAPVTQDQKQQEYGGQKETDWLYTGHPADVVPAATTEAPVAAASDYDPDFDFERPRNFAAESPRAESNVIYFPRPTWPGPPSTHELAEPVIERPRILDVPEELMPTIQGPLFADIRLDGHEVAPEPVAAPQFELPLRVAMVPARVYAGLVDLSMVTVASAIFCAIAWVVAPTMPHTKPMLAAAVVIPAFFWCVYQYLFLVYAGATAGMKLAGVRLSTFKGKAPSWSERRSRALSLALSCITVGLGFAWAVVDQDLLCWHDRLSKTYVTQR